MRGDSRKRKTSIQRQSPHLLYLTLCQSAQDKRSNPFTDIKKRNRKHSRKFPWSALNMKRFHMTLIHLISIPFRWHTVPPSPFPPLSDTVEEIQTDPHQFDPWKLFIVTAHDYNIRLILFGELHASRIRSVTYPFHPYAWFGCVKWPHSCATMGLQSKGHAVIVIYVRKTVRPPSRTYETH